MARPTKFPNWATSGTNIVEPPDGKKASGWIAGEQPPASYFNYWQNLVQQWVEWFDEAAHTDGDAATFANVQVNGTLGTTGDTTVGTDGAANLQVNGALTATGLATVGTLTTGGLTTVGGNLDVNGNSDVHGGDFRVLAGVIKVSGLYTYNTPPTFTKAISVAQGGGSVQFGQYLPLGPGAEHTYVVDAPHGATLGSVRVKVLAFGATSVHYTVRLMHRSGINFTNTDIPDHTSVDLRTATLTTGPDAVNISPSFGSLAVSKDETYEINVRSESDSGAGTELRVLALDYAFVDPGPRNH
jgi:hypothetical protein